MKYMVERNVQHSVCWSTAGLFCNL